MKKYMIDSSALRTTFMFVGVVIWLGIWLTGFSVVHWMLFVPAIFLTFAGITGVCPGLIINRLIFEKTK